MGITEKILLVLFAVFALLAVLRLFAAPLKLAGKLLVNTLLGFALLGILSALGVLAKISGLFSGNCSHTTATAPRVNALSIKACPSALTPL